MKNLEGIIRNNRDSFDVHEPSFNHFEQFKKRMLVSKKKKVSSFLVVGLLSVAASLMLLLGLFFNRSININLNKKADLGDVSHEYREVEVYYQANYTQRLIEYKKIAKNKPTPDSTVLHDLSKLNREYSELQEDLATADNEQVINAMIGNYRLRIALLDKVINTLSGYTF